jgi:hypothetical protein
MSEFCDEPRRSCRTQQQSPVPRPAAASQVGEEQRQVGAPAESPVESFAGFVGPISFCAPSREGSNIGPLRWDKSSASPNAFAQFSLNEVFGVAMIDPGESGNRVRRSLRMRIDTTGTIRLQGGPHGVPERGMGATKARFVSCRKTPGIPNRKEAIQPPSVMLQFEAEKLVVHALVHAIEHARHA